MILVSTRYLLLLLLWVVVVVEVGPSCYQDAGW